MADNEVLAVPKVPESLAGLGRALAAQLDDNTEALTEAMATGIPGLPVDPTMRRLLHDSVRENLQVAASVYAGTRPMDTLEAPSAALEYARRLAQVEAPPNALARAYHWGQFMTTQWAAGEFAKMFPDVAVQLAALRHLEAVNFWHIDNMSELVLAEYQAERDRWVAHRSTVRSEALQRILQGEDMDLPTAEAALSVRLSGTHLAVIIWTDDPRASSAGLAGLETAARRVAAAAGASDRPLFWARDATTAWAWASWSRGETGDLDQLQTDLLDIGPQIRVAIGAPGRGVTGFRESHRDALLAAQVSRLAGDTVPAVVCADDPGLRSAALLAANLDGAARLVSMTLAGLAADTAAAGRLREFLQVFLEEGGSHTATASRLHIHKNTVAYRIGKAVKELGRPLEENRTDLHLALAACRWLGPSVLMK